MFYDKESDFEDDLVAVLKRHGWTDGVLEYPTEQDLIDNWANILFDSNKGIDRLNGSALPRVRWRRSLNRSKHCARHWR